jgi:hypothetical protein
MLARERALQVALADAAKHVHEEGGANTGPRVREYQAATGRLLDGFTVVSRKDGTVHTVKATDGGGTVAEVCVGKSKVRLNFRKEQPAAARKVLDGKSKSWPGGGLIVTDANVTQARAMLTAAAGKPGKPAAGKPATTVSDVAAGHGRARG